MKVRIVRNMVAAVRFIPAARDTGNGARQRLGAVRDWSCCKGRVRTGNAGAAILSLFDGGGVCGASVMWLHLNARKGARCSRPRLAGGATSERVGGCRPFFMFNRRIHHGTQHQKT